MSTDCAFTALYRDWSGRGSEWVLIERTSGGVTYWRIRVDLPTLDDAIAYVEKEHGCPPEHWTHRDPHRLTARAAVGE